MLKAMETAQFDKFLVQMTRRKAREQVLATWI